MENLVKLWDLMETSEKEKAQFTKVASVFGSLEEEIVSPGLLSLETLKKVYLLFLLFPMVVTCHFSSTMFVLVGIGTIPYIDGAFFFHIFCWYKDQGLLVKFMLVHHL